MRMSPESLRGACFLCEERGDFAARKRTPVATGFFVSVPCEADPNVGWDYLVTARHVIEESQSDSIYVRINKKDQQGFVEYETRREDWFRHEQSDIAAIPSPVPMPSAANQLEYGPLGVGSCLRCLGPGPVYGEGGDDVVTIGDEVFAVGLFVQHYGKERNLPVARFGHIARMPDYVDIEYTINGYKTTLGVVAYLIEFLSWGGFSGSPVFWLIPSIAERFPRSLPWRLLGVVSSHFVIPKKADIQGDILLGEIRTKLNSGIAIVVPSEAVRELLTRQDIVSKRDDSRLQTR